VLDYLHKRPRLAAALLAVLLAALPFLMGFGLGNSWVRVLDFVLLYVLLAIGLSPEVAHGSLRFSLGRNTSEKELEYLLETLPGIVEKLRAMSPLSKGGK